MKKLLLLALLASCTSAPKEDATQSAVSAYLRKTLDDPASYQPAHWGPAQLWRKKDQALFEANAGRMQAEADSFSTASQYKAYQSTVRMSEYIPTYKAKIAGDKAKWQAAIATQAATRKRIDSLRAITDTARVGYLVTHAFRAKNKLGALVLDSARFEVDTNGQVKIWDSFKK